MRRILPALSVLALLIAAWEVGVQAAAVPDYVLPAPSQIARALFATRRSILPDIAATSIEAVLGLIVGAASGVAVALAMSLSDLVRRVLAPLLVTSQTVPIIVLAPLLVLWFGFGLLPKVVVVALMTFFPVAISALDGLTRVAPDQIDLIRSMGAGRIQTLRRVQIPHSVPAVFEGLRISSAFAVGGAVVGEWTGSSVGLGLYIDRSRASFKIDQVFAGILIVTALSLALFLGVDIAGRLIAPWYYRRRALLRSISEREMS